jgi:uncharacterized protein YgbK (DUF1537 family)
MTLALGSIADDYTGASDLANTLTRCGLRTIQTVGVPAADIALPEVDAVVVALKSRSIAAPQAVGLARAADDWLRKRGASHVMFKICSTFDSTDAGNIGPVTDALRAGAGSKIVLVTPAFPETARTVYQGNLFVGSVPLNESPLKDHPLNPMLDANLVRVLAHQSRCRIGLVDLAVVAAGVDAVGKCLAGLAGDGIEVAIADAVFERDLETIGTVALEHGLSVGASGLGLGLARALVQSGRVNPASTVAKERHRIGGLGDAHTSRECSTSHAAVATRPRESRGRSGGGEGCARLGSRAHQLRASADREQFPARSSWRVSSTPRTGSRRTRH